MSARPHVDARASKTSLWASACGAFGWLQTMQRSLLGFWLVLLLATTSIAIANHTNGTIYVDASRPAEEDTDGDRHFATLGAALAGVTAEQANTTVLIAPGTYVIQTLDVTVPGLILQSTAGPEKTVLQGRVALRSKNAVLQGFTIEAHGQTQGVLLSGPRAKLWQSVIVGAQEVGVLIQGGDNAEVDSSEVRASPIGIAIRSGSGARVSRSRITDNASAGVVVQRPAIGVTLSQNTISLNPGVGISVEGARASALLQNELRSNGLGARFTEAQDTLVYENTIAANRGPGLFLIQSQGNELIRNQITDNETSGIVLQASASNLIEANAITGHLNESAIELRGDSEANQIIRNKIEKNKIGLWFSSVPMSESERAPRANQIEFNLLRENEIGVKVEASDGSNFFSQNEIIENQTHGVHLLDIQNERLVKNKIANNGQTGLLMEKSRHNLMIENEIFSNGTEGIKSVASEDDLFEKNKMAENSIGVLLEAAKATEFKENNLEKNLADGLRVSGSDGVRFVQNALAENKALGFGLSDSQRIEFYRNLVRANEAGGVSLSDAQGIDLEENEFYSNAGFGLKADETAKDVTARRNFWSRALGPSNFVTGTPSGGEAAAGVAVEAVFPWLPAPRTELAEYSTQGMMWANETGGVSFEAERAGLHVRLSPEAAGAQGALVIARRLGPPPNAPILQQSLGYWAVQLTLSSTGLSAELEASYSEEEIFDKTEETFRLFVLESNRWKALDGKVLAEQNRVIGLAPTDSLREATLALAPFTAESYVMEPKHVEVPVVQTADQPVSTDENKRAQEAPRTEPETAPPLAETTSPTPPGQATSVNLAKLEIQTSHFVTHRKGVMERIAEIVQAVLRLEFAKAWRGVVALLQGEKPESPSSGPAGGSKKTLRE